MNKDTKVKFNLEYFEITSKKNNQTYKGLNINVVNNEGEVYFVKNVFLDQKEESIIDLVSKSYK